MAGVQKINIPNYGDEITHWQRRHNTLLLYENDIRRSLSEICLNAVNIGIDLLNIEKEELFRCVYYQGIGDYCKNIYQYAYQELDLSKTTVFNMMSVAKVFGDGLKGLKDEYKGYSFSQLVELLPLSEEARTYALPQMSVKDLRELKRGKEISFSDSIGQLKLVKIPTELLNTDLVSKEIPTSEQTDTSTTVDSSSVETIRSENVPTSEQLERSSETPLSVPTSKQTNEDSLPENSDVGTAVAEIPASLTNRGWLNTLSSEKFIEVLFEKYEEFHKKNFNPDLDEYEIDISAKVDLEWWLDVSYSEEKSLTKYLAPKGV